MLSGRRGKLRHSRAQPADLSGRQPDVRRGCQGKLELISVRIEQGGVLQPLFQVTNIETAKFKTATGSPWRVAKCLSSYSLMSVDRTSKGSPSAVPGTGSASK